MLLRRQLLTHLPTYTRNRLLHTPLQKIRVQNGVFCDAWVILLAYLTLPMFLVQTDQRPDLLGQPNEVSCPSVRMLNIP